MPVPDGVKRACRKGIAQVEEGLGGDGLEPATVKEARSLASGNMPTEAKIRKAYRWWARNERFLDAEADTPADVAANLWGGSAGMRWFRSLYDDLDTSESEQTSEKEMDRMKAIFKAAISATAENQITVVASTVGNMDRSGDVIAPGAFAKAVLRDFVQSGHLLASHEWDGEPLGFITEAKVVGNDLVSSATFHSTQKGQDYRTIAKERMDNEKSVSVSVGFMPDYSSVSYYENGAAMMKACEDMNMDLSAFDPKIRKWSTGCRLIGSVSELFEFSIVMVGMNPKAKAVAVKSLDFTGESAHGLTLEEHLEISLAGVERALEVAQMREADKRTLPESRLKIIKQINDLTGKLIGANDPEPVEPANDDAAVLAAYEARMRKLAHVKMQLQRL